MERCEDCTRNDHEVRIVRLETKYDNMEVDIKEIKADQKTSKNFQMTTLVGILIQLGFMFLSLMQSKGG